MKVELRFFAGLRVYLPQGDPPHLADLPEGATVADVLKLRAVPEDKPRIILVNGIHSSPASTLAEGDILSVFPPVAGG